MIATYTFDVFSSLDGFASHTGNWGGYWGKQCPELLEHRLAQYSQEQRMVFGANTYRFERSPRLAGRDPREWQRPRRRRNDSKKPQRCPCARTAAYR